jgi:restriction system protein
MKRLWLGRLGRNGEYEATALDQNLLTIGFSLKTNLSGAKSREEVLPYIESAFPGSNAARQRNFAAQVNQFVNTMQIGDIVVSPIKSLSCIAIGEVAGSYEQRPDGGPARKVKWLSKDVPRTSFKQDLLFSLGAIMTVCEIKRNDALNRVLTLAATGTDPGFGSVPNLPPKAIAIPLDDGSDQGDSINLEEVARDQIVARIASVFTGHGLTALVEAILVAQGYVTHRSPPGPDGGYDIVVGRGALGFDPPRLVVQVKSGNIVADAPTLQSLNGCITDAKADHGLLVSWGGFKRTVRRRINELYFRVRLWGQDDLIEALLSVYDTLSEDIRAALPLRRTWTLVQQPDEDLA